MTTLNPTAPATKTQLRVPIAELNPAVYASSSLGFMVISAGIGIAVGNLMVVYAGVGLSLAAIFIGLAAQPLRERTKPVGTATSESTSVLAVIALVAGCLGFAVVAIALGHVARNQILRDGGRGDRIALAALLIGYAEIFLTVLAVVWVVTGVQALR
ncbi:MULTISPECIES: DUF4190 domain-containing protein [unclassified Leifsonia]|uniref:DUF4190 domain-containing protein n=1 Tax=unclassified Leifsonia TaxID=2663824 RepID=UPI0008A7511D|nr:MULTISPECIES: DUF4190 domain-containing protein [unclassified Leifsonia]SEI09961.1 protein of unknown function [Leifsonia sp. CL154]SFL87033.1 protein of unknown function [Leifsonia sp. CL147]